MREFKSAFMTSCFKEFETDDKASKQSVKRMREVIFRIFVLAALTVCAPTTSSSQAGREEKSSDDYRVLFVGNSFTHYNDLPAILSELSRRGAPRVIHTKMIAVNGATLQDHWENGRVLRELERERWHVVVLQENSLLILRDRETMHRFSCLFDEAIKKHGAQTVFYLIPAYQDDPAAQQKITAAYLEIAQQLGARIAPVGIAFQKALKGKFDLSLHAADRVHPNVKGSYLAACVFYATLCGLSPENLPPYSGKLELDKEEEKYLRAVAWQTVRATALSKVDSTNHSQH